MDERSKKGLNLTPPGEGFDLYRHRNADRLNTRGWSGLYWVRRITSGDYEIRSVAGEGEGHSYPGGVFPGEAFERLYAKVSD